MENQTEQILLKKHRFLNGKVVAASVACAAILGGGAYLLLSKSSPDILKRSSAVAVESFEDIFLPQTAREIISEVAVSSSSFVSGGETSKETSSLAEENMGIPAIADNSYSHKKAQEKSLAVNDAGAGEKDSGVAITNTSPLLKPVPAGIFPPVSVSASGTTNEVLPVAPSSSGECSFSESVPANMSRRIVLNEIAWMGSPSSTDLTAEQSANGEWMELANISGVEVSSRRMADTGRGRKNKNIVRFGRRACA